MVYHSFHFGGTFLIWTVIAVVHHVAMPSVEATSQSMAVLPNGDVNKEIVTGNSLMQAARVVSKNLASLAQEAEEVQPTEDANKGPPRNTFLQANLTEGFDFSRYGWASNNPHMHMEKDSFSTLLDFIRHVANGARKFGSSVNLLDVGGNSGKDYEKAMASLVNYTSLDFVAVPPSGMATTSNTIVGNVMKHNPTIADGSYDVVTALNVFEHLVAPWEAAEEMKRWTRDLGFIVVAVPFAWRYHAYPLDVLRYTHTEMRYLFERSGGVRTLYAAYATYPFIEHGHYADHSDEPPDSNFVQPVELLWIGQKDKSAVFDPESLDAGGGFEGPVGPGLPEPSRS
mmetsp:Transcript_86846/g.254168  ORF Transcript_86846/g.254168 Transcript_86846/m.254168 type:complete len:341 (+) Transcript_86846:98-1120(+)